MSGFTRETADDFIHQLPTLAQQRAGVNCWLKGITLFSGMGGSAWGMERAGIKDVFFNDFEPHAIQSLKLNFPGLPADCYDGRPIEQVTGTDIMDRTGLGPDELFMLQMSPPCQDFSLLNTSPDKAESARNQLYAEGMRIAEELKPKVLVLENVPGLVNNQEIFLDIWADFAEYYLVDAWQLDSGYYGSNQSRPRVWIVGYRKDLGIQPTKPKWVSKPVPVGKVLPWVKWIYSQQFGGKFFSADVRPMPTVTKTPNIDFVYDWTTSEAYNLMQQLAMPERSELTENLLTFEPDEDLYDPETYRLLLKMKRPTIEELLVLSDFPWDMQFQGNSTLKNWNRIGNTVLPGMMETLSRHIIKETTK